MATSRRRLPDVPLPAVWATEGGAALPLREEEVSDLVSFTTLVGGLADPAGGQFWFRGCSDSRYTLVPSLFRHPTITPVEGLLEVEVRLLTRFKQRSVPFVQTRLPEDNWENLFLMQHYGVPTRLLDWSENALVGLWFALQPSPCTSPDEVSAAVWVFDPVSWNRKVFEHQTYTRGVLSAGEVQLDGYAPGATVDLMNTAPVALYGTHNSPRIVAQRGVFTIAGKDRGSLEAFAQGADYPTLTKILIPGNAQKSMLEELRRIGVTESMIYPDLPGLAQELRVTEGFGD
jgi:hypothetical protein